jgi:hypothetical protein
MGGPLGAVLLGLIFAFLVKSNLGATTTATIEFQDESELVVRGRQESINWLVTEVKKGSSE